MTKSRLLAVMVFILAYGTQCAYAQYCNPRAACFQNCSKQQSSCNLPIAQVTACYTANQNAWHACVTKCNALPTSCANSQTNSTVTSPPPVPPTTPRSPMDNLGEALIRLGTAGNSVTDSPAAEIRSAPSEPSPPVPLSDTLLPSPVSTVERGNTMPLAQDIGTESNASADSTDRAPASENTNASNYYDPSTPSNASPDPYVASVQEGARNLLDEGLSRVMDAVSEKGKDAYDLTKAAIDVVSGDSQKRLDGAFELADKANDIGNGNEASKAVTQTLLPVIHNFADNTANLIDSAKQALSPECLTTTSDTCNDASRNLDHQWDHWAKNPFAAPSDDWSGVFNQ